VCIRHIAFNSPLLQFLPGGLDWRQTGCILATTGRPKN
jgi:hypothetical protein